MRGQLGAFLPRQQNGRQRPGNRAAALHYAAWDWPITPNTALPPTQDLEHVFAAWSRLPQAPILAACGAAFDVVEADPRTARTALARLDRLAVDLGPVTVDPDAVCFLVRAGSARALSPLIVDGDGGPKLLGKGTYFELPRSVHAAAPRAGVLPQSAERRWLRVPDPAIARPSLPAAHVVLGALAMVPYRALATASAR